MLDKDDIKKLIRSSLFIIPICISIKHLVRANKPGRFMVRKRLFHRGYQILWCFDLGNPPIYILVSQVHKKRDIYKFFLHKIKGRDSKVYRTLTTKKQGDR